MMRRSSGALEQDLKNLEGKINTRYPIVYSPGYNVTACGIERMHPFDSTKYGRINQFLRDSGCIDENATLFAPDLISRIYLYEVCTYMHLMLLNYSLYITKCVEVPVFFLPAWLIRWRVLNPMLRATYGTVVASKMAMERGIAINLSGGYHHACGGSGGGF